MCVLGVKMSGGLDVTLPIPFHLTIPFHPSHILAIPSHSHKSSHPSSLLPPLTLPYSPIVLYVGRLLPESLHELRHVLGVLLVDPRQLVVEVTHWKAG